MSTKNLEQGFDIVLKIARLLQEVKEQGVVLFDFLTYNCRKLQGPLFAHVNRVNVHKV